MKSSIFCLFLLILSYNSIAQNLFPKKLNNCVTDKFCLDCGDTKANVDREKFSEFMDDQNKTGAYKGMTGKIKVQVLLDSVGQGCILSHTDTSEHPVTKQLVKSLNNFDGWIPAVTDGKPVGKVSFNMAFEIKNGMLTGNVERVDMEAFEDGFDRPVKPEIYNKSYKYKNNSLSNYTFTIWNSKNSELKNNMNDDLALDSSDNLWLAVSEGLYRLEDKKLINTEQNITDKGKFFSYYALEIDNSNTVWVFTSKGLYSFAKNQWTKHEPTDIFGIDSGYDIINNEKTGEVFFCSDEGLTVYNEGKWSNINKDLIKELPSNRVYFAKKDATGRTWIGTFSGSIMIDAGGKATNLNNTDTPLKNQCITSMTEDDKGNIYFGVYEYNGKKGEVNRNEGIVVHYADDSWKQFTTENSGIPINHTTDVLYDRHENVLWITTDRAGLVRFDLKDGWENYHSDNSQIPTSYISSIVQDKHGNIYLGTRQGLVKMQKK